MSQSNYAYSAESTRNPFRYALAVWRFLRSNTDDNIVPEVAIIEIGFARSRFGRRLARWEVVLDRLRDNSDTSQAVEEKRVSDPIDLTALESLEEGTLGQVFAEHCRNRGIEV